MDPCVIFFRLIDNHKTSNIVISLQASIDYFTIYGNSSLSIHVFKTGNRRYPIHYLLVRAEVDMNELQTMNEVLRVSSDYNCAIMSPGSKTWNKEVTTTKVCMDTNGRSIRIFR